MIIVRFAFTIIILDDASEGCIDWTRETSQVPDPRQENFSPQPLAQPCAVCGWIMFNGLQIGGNAARPIHFTCSNIAWTSSMATTAALDAASHVAWAWLEECGMSTGPNFPGIRNSYQKPTHLAAERGKQSGWKGDITHPQWQAIGLFSWCLMPPWWIHPNGKPLDQRCLPHRPHTASCLCFCLTLRLDPALPPHLAAFARNTWFQTLRWLPCPFVSQTALAEQHNSTTSNIQIQKIVYIYMTLYYDIVIIVYVSSCSNPLVVLFLPSASGSARWAAMRMPLLPLRSQLPLADRCQSWWVEVPQQLGCQPDSWWQQIWSRSSGIQTWIQQRICPATPEGNDGCTFNARSKQSETPAHSNLRPNMCKKTMIINCISNNPATATGDWENGRTNDLVTSRLSCFDIHLGCLWSRERCGVLQGPWGQATQRREV